jgi:hypothetical protein
VWPASRKAMARLVPSFRPRPIRESDACVRVPKRKRTVEHGSDGAGRSICGCLAVVHRSALLLAVRANFLARRNQLWRGVYQEFHNRASRYSDHFFPDEHPDFLRVVRTCLSGAGWTGVYCCCSGIPGVDLGLHWSPIEHSIGESACQGRRISLNEPRRTGRREQLSSPKAHLLWARHHPRSPHPVPLQPLRAYNPDHTAQSLQLKGLRTLIGARDWPSPASRSTGSFVKISSVSCTQPEYSSP